MESQPKPYNHTAGGGPERLRIILEGESLLNDASSITLFTIFIEFVIEAAEGHPNTSSAGHIVGTIVRRMIWLAVGEDTRPHACLSTASARQELPFTMYGSRLSPARCAHPQASLVSVFLLSNDLLELSRCASPFCFQVAA